MADDFILANVRVDGNRPEHVAIRAGRLFRRAPLDDATPAIDAAGGRLVPGLVDHHLHLMAEAARLRSVDLSDLASPDPEALATRIRETGIDGDIRAIGLDDAGMPLLDVTALDAVTPDRPLRVQYRTGGLWVLNSADLDRTLARLSEIPPAFERDAAGRLTGRVWRGDIWLRRAATLPALDAIGAQLARWGVTAVTDASVTTDQPQAEAIAAAAASGALPQHLTLMSGGPLRASAGWEVGPVKILLDDAALPDLDTLVATIDDARRQGRNIAAHVVTAAELAVMLAAWEIAGPAHGDRIEHGSILPAEALDSIVRLGLIVVTNPGFILSRGDRYLATQPRAERQDLYRLRSLRDAGIPIAAGSDAPYGPLDPWRSIEAATHRRTQSGKLLTPQEAVPFEQALVLHSTDPRHAGRPVVLTDGAPADLVLLADDHVPRVAMTIIGGKPVYRATTTIAA